MNGQRAIITPIGGTRPFQATPQDFVQALIVPAEERCKLRKHAILRLVVILPGMFRSILDERMELQPQVLVDPAHLLLWI